MWACWSEQSNSLVIEYYIGFSINKVSSRTYSQLIRLGIKPNLMVACNRTNYLHMEIVIIFLIVLAIELPIIQIYESEK